MVHRGRTGGYGRRRGRVGGTSDTLSSADIVTYAVGTDHQVAVGADGA
jgi:hypothetical protein